MVKEEFFFDSWSGNGKMHAVRYSPEGGVESGQKPRGVLQVVHGMAE